ncbi:predicted protein [Uncinocarpus reesii 1704]|uniref:ML-like domain-containing protein n=1 Tax=Uncinocarpus reesii (strain UAMH 1704) TaxID=336963 RepID=C4JU43_UNCRE|nr:uncharacterized protein UREG_05982 [Uncinocarpus reesii 1704]EEP81140.1 predicted protein [Uncinocarpus reesii 1704]
MERNGISQVHWKRAVLLFSVLSYSPACLTENTSRSISTIGLNSDRIYLTGNRKPSLYTKGFTSCMGNPLISITRLDAAIYNSNETFVFHLEGSTSVPNSGVIIDISIFAYGMERFRLAFDPCSANMSSLCPLDVNIRIKEQARFSIAQLGVMELRPTVYKLPDFEGQVILRTSSKSSASHLSYYVSELTNGASFSHPYVIGPMLAAFTVLSMLSSFALAIYAGDIESTRTHYAHGPSTLAIFAIFHHIYSSGALAVNWPSALVAFWSNYSWFAGMIYSQKMQSAIDWVTGNDLESVHRFNSCTLVTIAPPGQMYNLTQRYTKLSLPIGEGPSIRPGDLLARAPNMPVSDSSGYPSGSHSFQSHTGFPMVLSAAKISASNAFLTSLLWLLAFIGAAIAAIISLKAMLDFFIRFRLVRTGRLEYFRAHWLAYALATVFRLVFINFFFLSFLALFQLKLGGSKAVVAIAATTLAIVSIGLLGVSGYALHFRLRGGKLTYDKKTCYLQKTYIHKVVPWYRLVRDDVSPEDDPDIKAIRLPCYTLRYRPSASERDHIHTDCNFLLRFSWLSARYRSNRWWFFSLWVLYDLARAGFLGAAAPSGMIQVFGLLCLELISVILIAWAKPFEATRLNVLMLYLLGFSKIATLAISSTFHPAFNLGRITTAFLGLGIIALHTTLSLALLVSIATGLVSTYLSFTRYREIAPRDRPAKGLRQRYLNHVTKASSRKRRQESVSRSPVAFGSLRGPSLSASSTQGYPRVGDGYTTETPTGRFLSPTTSQVSFGHHFGSSFPQIDSTRCSHRTAERTPARESSESDRGVFEVF